MTLAIDATVGGTASNSYITVAEADAYFEAVPGYSATWAALTSASKIQRLVHACRAIDRYNFLGYKTDADQALKFPRVLYADIELAQQYSTINPSGSLPVQNLPDGWADSDTIPQDVKSAQCEMIRYLHTSADATTGLLSRDIDRVAIPGVVDVTFSDTLDSSQNSATGGSLQAVADLLRVWLLGRSSFQVLK